jgi:hypothetical protein
LKMSSLPSLAFIYPNKIYIWCLGNSCLYRYRQRNTSYILSFIGRCYLLQHVLVRFLNHLHAIYIYIYEFCYIYNGSIVFGSNYLSVFIISSWIYFVYINV